MKGGMYRIYTVNSEFWWIFFFVNSLKRHICQAKNSRWGHDLPTSVNDSDFVILGGFNFHKKM